VPERMSEYGPTSTSSASSQSFSTIAVL